MTSRRGLGLVEALIAGALLLLLMTVALSFLYPSFRSSSRGAQRVDMQQRVSMALEAILIDMERSAAASVSLFPGAKSGDPVGLSMQRIEGFTGTGLQIWEKSFVTYHWVPGSKRLIREVWPPASPTLSVLPQDTRPSRLSTQDFLDMVKQKNGSEKLVADAVEAFSVTPATPPASQPFQISLVMEREVQGRTQKERFELHRTVSLRNDW